MSVPFQRIGVLLTCFNRIIHGSSLEVEPPESSTWKSLRETSDHLDAFSKWSNSIEMHSELLTSGSEVPSLRTTSQSSSRIMSSFLRNFKEGLNLTFFKKSKPIIKV